MIRTLLLATGMMLLIGGSAVAQGLETEPLAEGKPCAYADVVGLWESQVVTAGETGVEAHYARFPRDYMRFSADGGMMYYGSSQPETDVSKIRKSLDEHDALDRVTYSAEMLSPGLLLLRRDGAPFQGFTCTATGGPAGKPAFILTQLKGMPSLRRLQRRLD
jgi:hypothetical protein